jgi:hypothetical protein
LQNGLWGRPCRVTIFFLWKNRGMYLKCHKRIKDGKQHRYWSVVESVRTRRGVVKRQVFYLGELNDAQRAQWCSALDVLDESNDCVRQMSLFPDDRTPPPEVSNPVQIRLSQMTLRHPRQWGGCWLAMELWNQLELDSFWGPRLPDSRKGTGWINVLTRSGGRRNKEQSMRRRRLKKLWKRLHQIQGMKNQKRDALLLRLGAEKKEAGNAWRLVDINIPEPRQPVTSDTFTFSLNRQKLRKARRSEGTYLLRTNLTAGNPEDLWKQYIVLTEVEQAFKELKNDLDIRPVCHQKYDRIESHIFVSFLSYCLQVTLKQRAKVKAPGLTPRAILEKFKAMQMIDVHLPTTDGRNLILPRYTQPEKDLQLLLHQLKLTLPDQPALRSDQQLFRGKRSAQPPGPSQRRFQGKAIRLSAHLGRDRTRRGRVHHPAQGFRRKHKRLKNPA